MATSAAIGPETRRADDSSFVASETKAAKDQDGVSDGQRGTETRRSLRESTKNKEEEEKRKKKKSRLREAWESLGLDIPTVLMMMKAALPPTIALAMYQADSVAKLYSTLGYLVAIISILGFCIMPRAKFVQTMTMNVIGTCIGAAVGLLMVWSGVQARLHTSSAGAPPQRYNSSQSAVCAVWLFFQIWLVSAVKAKYPQLAFPTIVYSIFVNVAATYGPQFTTTAQAKSFVQQLLESFLTAFALATGVSLFILPVSCRKVVGKEITGYISALRGALQAHKDYLQSLETTDMFAHSRTKSKENKSRSDQPQKSAEVEALKKLTATFTELHGKLHGDIPFAKREIAYGKLTPDDYEGIFKHLRNIMMPLVGLGSIADLFDRTAEQHHWEDQPDTEPVDPESYASHLRAVNEWNNIMQAAHESFATIIQSMDEGLEHVLRRLQLIKTPKIKNGTKANDAEAKGNLVLPGEPEFTRYLEDQCANFYQGKETTLRQWVENKGIKLADDFFQNPDATQLPVLDKIESVTTKIRHGNEKQLFLVLYIVYLLHSTSRAILAFVKFSDERDQAKLKSKIIWPGKRRIGKWIASLFKPQDANNEDEMTVAGLETGGNIVLGAAYAQKKDPEHLPPQNAWERFGDLIRATTGFLRSPESSFGFRCACATMSIAVVAYLHDTQQFFIEQRLVWAMIMVALSMTPTSGQSVFTFLLRILGTIIAMIVALLMWYIPAQNTAGIIVFLWVFVALGFYIPLKRMDLVIVGIISVVTATMIVGYELEVRKIGKTAATSNGQPYYPIYVLGPYRLATVVGGLAVAFIWTFFPYPISEHSALRQKLGGALYLSANYYSIVHETVMSRIRGDEGDPSEKTSPAYQLNKARYKVFAKQMMLLQGLKAHSTFVKWELPLGGKFPRKEYDTIIQLLTNIINYTSLLVYASETFSSLNAESDDPTRTQWLQDFQRIIGLTNVTSHEITSMLALLSSSITNGQPLPPYLVAPQSYQLARRMEAVDQDVLSLKHVAEPGYAAFAVLQISTSCINADLEKLLRVIKKLVGELDFSYHIVSTQTSGENSSSETLVKSSTTRSKQD